MHLVIKTFCNFHQFLLIQVSENNKYILVILPL